MESTGRFSKRALEWCKDIAKRQAERRRLPHLPDQNITNERGTYDPEAIKKFHYNVAEAQLELHRQNMEWCIGTIAKARHRHIDVEPEIDEKQKDFAPLKLIERAQNCTGYDEKPKRSQKRFR